MPVNTNFALNPLQDALIGVSMQPGVNISGWSIQFQMSHRFGWVSGMVTKSMASGFVNVSGIALVDGNQGMFNIQMNSVDTSGLDYGNYAYNVQRLDSGYRSVLSEGYVMLGP